MGKGKVLVVDDEPDILMAMKMKLESLDCLATTASTGKEALNKITEEKPDVVLLDIILKGKDGFEVCREIKRTFPDVKVLIYTAKIEGVNVTKAREAGADDFVVKTGNFAAIIESLNKFLPAP